MKRQIVKLLFVVVMIVVASLPEFMYGGNIKVVKKDNTVEQYPRLSPSRNNPSATAYFFTRSGLLKLWFHVNYPNAEIGIYKDGVLIISTNTPLCSEEEFFFELASYGQGFYEIVVTIDDEEDIYGSFQY